MRRLRLTQIIHQITHWMRALSSSTGAGRTDRISRALLLCVVVGCAIPSGISAQSLAPETNAPTASQAIAAGIRLMQARDFKGETAQFSAALSAGAASADALVWRGSCREPAQALCGSGVRSPAALGRNRTRFRLTTILRSPCFISVAGCRVAAIEYVIEGDPGAEAAS